MYDYVNTLSPVIYSYIILKLGNKVYNWMRTEILTLINDGRAHKVLNLGIILFTWD